MTTSSSAKGQNNISHQPVSNWLQQLPQGKVGSAGVLLQLHNNLETAPEAIESLRTTIIDFMQSLLPTNSVLLEDNAFLTAWLPLATAEETEVIYGSVLELIATLPAADASNEAPLLELAINFSELVAHEAAAPALEKLQQALPSTETAVSDNQHEAQLNSPVAKALTATLSGVAHFSRETICQQIISHLQLPAIVPRMVIINGPPLCGKSRLLHGVVRVLSTHRYPTAEICCRVEEQSLPYSLLAAIVYQLCRNHPAHILLGILTELLAENRWLGKLFPMLGSQQEDQQLPEDPTEIRTTLISMLMILTATLPHIVMIDNLHYADSESLAALALLQQEAGHSLRILATASALTLAAQAILLQQFTTFTLKLDIGPLEREQQRELLQQIFPTMSVEQRAQMVEILAQAEMKLPLHIEALLRHWQRQRALTLQNDNWSFSLQSGKEPTQILSPVETRRLAQIALIAPVTEDFLRQLWQTTMADTRRTITTARILGYLAKEEKERTHIVRFADDEYQDYFAHLLSSTETAASALKINTLLGKANGDASSGLLAKRAALLTCAGKKTEADTLRNNLRLTLTAITPLLCWPQISEQEQSNIWNPPPAQSSGVDEVGRIIVTAQALRLSAMQYRLYPAESDMARTCLRQAISALEEHFSRRSAFLISHEGRNVTFEGKTVQRREMQRTLQDFNQWMSEAEISAFVLLPEIREDELARFFFALAAAEQSKVVVDLPTRIVLLNMTHVKVLSPHILPDTPKAVQQTPYPLSLPVAATSTEATISPIYSTPAVDSTAVGNETPTLVPTSITQLADPEAMLADDWSELDAKWASLPADERRRGLNFLIEWLRNNPDQQLEYSTTEQIDHFISSGVPEETDLATLQDTTVALEERCKQLIKTHDWQQIFQLLQPLAQRIAEENDASTQIHLQGVLRRIVSNMKDTSALLSLRNEPEKISALISLLEIIGDSPLLPLIEALKNSPTMEERNRLMYLLRRFGTFLQPSLLRELGKPNLWYVYRNMLLILADIGDSQALPIASEFLKHQDARVRVEALTVVGKINAGGEAVQLILRALTDSDLAVRTKAANIIPAAPEADILKMVIALLKNRGGNNNEESFQMALVSSLASFRDVAARDALLQLLFPAILSPYHGKEIAIRAIAAHSLAAFLPDPVVEKALQKALHARQQPLRQAAQRALQSLNERSK